MKLVILDRDGVINHDSDQYIKSVDEWIPIDGSLNAIAKLNKAGFRVGVATNQSGIARGYYGEDTLHVMHDKMFELLQVQGGRVDQLRFCPHGPDDDCLCRKPKAGMLLDIMSVESIDAAETIFVGDTIGDQKAAASAGVEFALVKTGKGQRTLQAHPEIFAGTPVYENLAAFAAELIAKESSNG